MLAAKLKYFLTTLLVSLASLTLIHTSYTVLVPGFAVTIVVLVHSVPAVVQFLSEVFL